jgi:hypothetical protein
VCDPVSLERSRPEKSIPTPASGCSRCSTASHRSAGGARRCSTSPPARRADAARQADLFRRTTIAQANVLRAVSAYEDKVKGLRETKGSFGFGNQAPPTLGKEQSSAGFALRSLLARDPFEIANWGNVSAIARDLRGQAHAIFADAIEALRPKALGFKSEAALELDLLRAGFGETTKDPRAGSAADAWFKAEGMLADEYIAAGGQLAKRERYMPNPDFDRAKVQALGPDRFRALVDANVDREKMIDFSTNAPMTDTRYNELVRRAYDNIVSNSLEGTVPSAPCAAARWWRTRARRRGCFRGRTPKAG